MSRIQHTAEILLNIMQGGNATQGLKDLSYEVAKVQTGADRSMEALSKGLTTVARLASVTKGELHGAFSIMDKTLQAQQRQATANRLHAERLDRRDDAAAERATRDKQRQATAVRKYEERLDAQDDAAGERATRDKQKQAIAVRKYQEKLDAQDAAKYEREQSEAKKKQEQETQAKQRQAIANRKYAERLDAQDAARERAEKLVAEREAAARPFGSAYGRGYAGVSNAISVAPGRGIEALAGSGGAMAIGGAVAAAAAAYGTLVTAASGAAHALDIMGNGATTNAQKMDSLFAQFVPGGEALLHFRDALNGVAEKMRRLEWGFQEAVGRQKGLAEVRSAAIEGRAQVGYAAARAHFLGQIEVNRPPLIDRSTYAGRIEYDKQQRLLPLQDELKRAQAEAAAARVGVMQSEERTRERKHEFEGANRRHAEAVEAYEDAKRRENEGVEAHKSQALRKAMKIGAWGGGPVGALGYLAYDMVANSARDKPGLTGAAKDQQLGTGDMLNRQNELLKEKERLERSSLTLAEKESAVRKAQIAIAQAELQFLKEKEQRSLSNAERLGMQGPAERSFNAAQLAMVQRMSAAQVANLPASIKQAAAAADPELVREKLQAAGRATPEFRQRAMAGQPGYEDVEEIRKKYADSQHTARLDIKFDAEKFAQDVMKLLSVSFNKMVGILVERVELDLKKLREGRMAATAAGR